MYTMPHIPLVSHGLHLSVMGQLLAHGKALLRTCDAGAVAVVVPTPHLAKCAQCVVCFWGVDPCVCSRRAQCPESEAKL